jgi:hypothetical protein
MKETAGSDNVSTRLQRVAELAKAAPGKAFTSLSNYIDVELLREAYRRTRKSGARGVDGLTAEEYEKGLEENLVSLLERFKAGTCTYRKGMAHGGVRSAYRPSRTKCFKGR